MGIIVRYRCQRAPETSRSCALSFGSENLCGAIRRGNCARIYGPIDPLTVKSIPIWELIGACRDFGSGARKSLKSIFLDNSHG